MTFLLCAMYSVMLLNCWFYSVRVCVLCMLVFLYVALCDVCIVSPVPAVLIREKWRHSKILRFLKYFSIIGKFRPRLRLCYRAAAKETSYNIHTTRQDYSSLFTATRALRKEQPQSASSALTSNSSSNEPLSLLSVFSRVQYSLMRQIGIVKTLTSW